MDILLAFIIGNLAKFSAHLFFPYEEIALIIAMPIACIAIYIITKRCYIIYIAAAMGFAGHECLFAFVGRSLGLMYQQYPLGSFVGSFIFFLLLQLIVNLLLCVGVDLLARYRKHQSK